MNFISEPSVESLVSVCASGVIGAITEAWSAGKGAHIVITGGRTGLRIVQAIDQALFGLIRVESSFEGSILHLWFSDERFTARDDPDRNDTGLIAGFGLCKSQIVCHRVDAPIQIETGDLEVAAKNYAAELDLELGGRPFDAVILSMGEDGHIASLFPGLFAPDFTGAAIAVHNSPKAPPQRVSISLTRLANARQIYIFALGEGKAAALQGIATGPVGLLEKSAPSAQLHILTDLSAPSSI